MQPKEVTDKILHQLETDAELKRLESVGSKSEPTEALSCAGIPYQLNGVDVNPTMRGIFIALSAIQSPIIGDLSELTDADVYRALYAICGGIEPLRPIMALEQRLRRLRDYEDAAKTSAELFAAYLDNIDRAQTSAWESYDQAAMQFCEQYGAVDVQEIFQLIVQIIKDARAALDSIRGGSKKNATIANGQQEHCTAPQQSASMWRRCLTWLRRNTQTS